MVRPASHKVLAAASEVGEQLKTWRKLLGLTAEQLSQRAGIARSTLRRIEQGDAAVNFQAVLRTMNALGILDRMSQATDPYETDFGRARADQTLPERVRS
ncbi:MAG: helix-turn-helix domain-containing protein [Coriobacteriia bacterium]|nr:helix-turn-helix domain-containing protein [Coriobacteriia bacterium]